MFSNMMRAPVVIALMISLFISCGGNGSSGSFDDPTLEANKTAIQSNVGEASIVFTGTITAIGEAPVSWSGVSISSQNVTYIVDSVLKGSLSGDTVVISHLVVDGTRQASTDASALNTTIFAVGSKLIVFANPNSIYSNLGDGWEVPQYFDVDADYGTIPYSAQNESVIKSMISSPSADLSCASEAMALSFKKTDTSKTLVIEGDPADTLSFYNLLDACRAKSTSLENLWQQINNSETYEVTLNIKRNPANVLVDSFRGRIVDIDDLEKWHEGCDQKTDLCQIFGHFLQEYWHAAVTGDGYMKSHESALEMENQIRKDLGKTTVLDGHYGVKKEGVYYVRSGYGDYVELVKLSGGSNPYPDGVQVVVKPPAAPTNCAADNSTSCQITVSWIDNSGDELGFEVERSVEGSGTWEIKYTSSADVTSWTNSKAADASLVFDTMYCYRVRAWKPDGMGDYTYSDYCTAACAKKQ